MMKLMKATSTEETKEIITQEILKQMSQSAYQKVLKRSELPTMQPLK